MAVKIRLRRVGRKKQPSYRMVVIESENPRGGAYLDTVGFYNPQQKPASLQIDLPKIDSWIKRGATMTETTDSLVRKARRGGDKTVAVSEMPRGPVAPASPAPAASAAPAAAELGREGEPGAGEPVVPQEPEAAAAERAESVE
jgi:small subunit ribosomal protein S16